MKVNVESLKKIIEEERRRDASGSIDFQLWSDDEILNLAAKKLFDDYSASKKKQRALSGKRYIPVIKVLILNLVKANQSNSYVGYGRSKRYYQSNRYNPIELKFDTICPFIDWLDQCGYLKNYISKKSRKANAKSSRVKAKDIFWKHIGISPNHGVERTFHPKTEYILLRELKDLDGKKTPIEYEETLATRKMREFLQSYNKLILSTSIKCDSKGFNDLHIVRIFNGDFNHGGRFFGGLEGVRRELRKTITLDGHETVEVDYKCLHPSMLYAQLGIQLNFDAYKIQGAVKYRGLVKVILNCILDCAPNRVHSAVGTAIYKAKKKNKPYPQPKDLKLLIKKTRDLNSPIAKYFATGCSLDLQHKDSQMAEAIMKVFVEKNMPILCVHDSFVVKKVDEQFLNRTMLEVYSAHNNGFKISIEPK